MPGRLERRLSQFLKTARGADSYAAFGKRCGLPKSTVYAIELGYSSVQIDTLEQIAKKLGVTLVDIFGDDATTILGKKKTSSLPRLDSTNDHAD